MHVILGAGSVQGTVIFHLQSNLSEKPIYIGELTFVNMKKLFNEVMAI